MTAQPEIKIAATPAYWTHGVEPFPAPVAQGRMAQLVDFDDRLYEQARIVYRFLVYWYHDKHGDALLSQRHVAHVMKQRAPAGAKVLSRSVVQRAILALMETGWVVRSYKGRGRNKSRTGSRYIPVANVTDLAAQGKFPELTHTNGPDDIVTEPAHAIGPDKAYAAQATGPDRAYAAHANGPKTHIQDTGTIDPCTCSDMNSPPVAAGLSAAAPQGGGFERLAAAYAKAGDNLAKARAAFNDIDPDHPELERMVRAAESWKRTATGKRMSLERWLKEKRWLTGAEYSSDARSTHRYPTCVITRITPRVVEDDFEGAKVWYRDRDGMQHMCVLDRREYGILAEACAADRPRVNGAGDDLHEFIGARFQLDEYGWFDPIRPANENNAKQGEAA
jgi:hypothetical protein